MRTSFNMDDMNITMIRGDTLAFNIQVDLDDDLDSAYFTCRANFNNAVFQKSLGDGIEKVEPKLYFVRIAPEDTAEIDAGMYYYDLQISVGGNVYTVMLGLLEIVQDVEE